MTNAMPCVRFRERFQVKVHDNPLGKLGHVDPLQQCVKVRLAGKNDLHLQRFPVVQIGEKPQFFEQLGTKTLCFINNKNDPSVLFGFLNQELREDVIGLCRVESLFAQSEGEQNPGQEMFNV